MMAKKTVAQRLGGVLERLTRQSGRLSETPAYGSWLLGRVSESQRRRRVRIQVILTVFIVAANLIGIGFTSSAASEQGAAQATHNTTCNSQPR